jgi:hypothetical protein
LSRVPPLAAPMLSAMTCAVDWPHLPKDGTAADEVIAAPGGSISGDSM